MRRVLPVLLALALPVTFLTVTAASAQTVPSVCRQTFAGPSFSAEAHFVGTANLTPTAHGTVESIAVTVSADGYTPDGDGHGAVLTLADTTSSKQAALVSITSTSAFSNVTFADAATAVYDGGPLSGSYKPELPLTELSGSSVSDTWQLVYGNTSGDTTVSVPAWSITVTYANCVTGSRISLGRHVHVWRGMVSSSKAFCRAQRRVTLYRIHSGRRQVVAHTHTSAAGTWKIRAANKAHSKYIAVAETKSAPGVSCTAATSRRMR